MMHNTPSRIRCSPIGDGDIEGLMELLSKGFRSRTRSFCACVRLLARARALAPYSRFGYALELDDTLIGAILLIYSM
jgi:hypothetical protein